jgi:glucose-6-phosphate isomerase, archaeal
MTAPVPDGERHSAPVHADVGRGIWSGNVEKPNRVARSSGIALTSCAVHERTSAEVIDLGQYAGFEVQFVPKALRLAFGPGVTAAPATVRHLDEVRPVLQDPEAAGPDHLYTIYMDVRAPGVTDPLPGRGLGYGAVVYNHGTLGREFLRSQGHVHSAPPETGVGYSELYEFWHGRGLVYMQSAVEAEVDDVIVIEAGPGDKIAIPPGWAHATVNVGDGPLVFGAVYAPAAELLYEPLRRRQGTAHYVLADGTLEPNPAYRRVPTPRRRPPHVFPERGIEPGRPALAALVQDASALDFVSRPEAFPVLWERLTRGS